MILGFLVFRTTRDAGLWGVLARRGAGLGSATGGAGGGDDIRFSERMLKGSCSRRGTALASAARDFFGRMGMGDGRKSLGGDDDG